MLKNSQLWKYVTIKVYFLKYQFFINIQKNIENQIKLYNNLVPIKLINKSSFISLFIKENINITVVKILRKT